MARRLVDRLAYSVRRRIARALRPRYVVARRMGALMLLDQANVVDRSLLIRGRWEADQVACLLSLAERRAGPAGAMTFLDIGAHGGLYAILVARRFPAARVVAFEPSPLNLAQMRANILMNGLLDRIEVVPKALGARVGAVDFVEASERNRGASRIASADVEIPPGERMSVEMTRADVEIRDVGALVVAKIDVEGAEFGVLEGMEGLFGAGAAFVLQIECNARRAGELRATMEARGFAFETTIAEDHFFTREAGAAATPATD